MSVTVGILLLGGSGSRMGEPIPKQFMSLGKYPLYVYALRTMVSWPNMNHVVVVVHSDYTERVSTEAKMALPERFRQHLSVVPGGKTRQESSYRGLLACPSQTDIVTIHDAARPFLTHDILNRNHDAMLTYSSAITMIECTDTIIERSKNGCIANIPNRINMALVQTPQTFRYATILSAHQDAIKNNIANATDDASLVFRQGILVQTILGSNRNIKITSPTDFLFAKLLLDTPPEKD